MKDISAIMLVETQEFLDLSGKVHQCCAEKSDPKRPDSSQSVQSPNLFRGDSLVPFRWESMNALDIASVLDSTFPSKSDSSTLTCEEGYALYNEDDLWMQPEMMLSKEVENCVADPLCEDARVTDGMPSMDVFRTNSRQPGEDCTSLFISNQDEGVLADCEWGNVSDFDEIGETTSLSTFEEMADDTKSMPTLPSSLLSCSMQKESALQHFKNNFCGETRESIPVIESREVSSITQCSSADMRSELTASQDSCSELDIKPQFHLPVPATDANGSPDKRKARARRVAANQRRAGGRAKKYLPYRLIPMPSPATTGGTNRMERLTSERHVIPFPIAQQPLQSVQMTPGVQLQCTVPSLPAMNGNEYPMLNESVEVGLFEQLKNSVRQLDEQTRLCIRDSLYRLARSAKERQNEAESRFMNKFMTKPTPSIIREGAVEAETNPLDRWMVNLLFCKLPNVSNVSSQPCTPFSTEPTSQVMLPSTIINQAPQQWNACGILPDFRLCTY